MSAKKTMPEKLPEEPETETSRTVIVRVKVDTHRALRVRVAELDTSIQDWVVALIERELGLRQADGNKQENRGR